MNFCFFLAQQSQLLVEFKEQLKGKKRNVKKMSKKDKERKKKCRNKFVRREESPDAITIKVPTALPIQQPISQSVASNGSFAPQMTGQIRCVKTMRCN